MFNLSRYFSTLSFIPHRARSGRPGAALPLFVGAADERLRRRPQRRHGPGFLSLWPGFAEQVRYSLRPTGGPCRRALPGGTAPAPGGPDAGHGWSACAFTTARRRRRFDQSWRTGETENQRCSCQALADRQRSGPKGIAVEGLRHHASRSIVHFVPAVGPRRAREVRRWSKRARTSAVHSRG